MTEFADEILDDRLKQLYAYWLDKKGERFAPARAEINPAEIPRLLPSIFIVEAVGEPPRFRMRLVGTALAEAYGEDVTGRFVDEMDLGHLGPEVIADYRTVMADRRPLLRQWRYVKRDGRFLEYQRIIMPLSSAGVRVDMFLGAAAMLYPLT